MPRYEAVKAGEEFGRNFILSILGPGDFKFEIRIVKDGETRVSKKFASLIDPDFATNKQGVLFITLVGVEGDSGHYLKVGLRPRVVETGMHGLTISLYDLLSTFDIEEHRSNLAGHRFQECWLALNRRSCVSYPDTHESADDVVI